MAELSSNEGSDISMKQQEAPDGSEVSVWLCMQGCEEVRRRGETKCSCGSGHDGAGSGLWSDAQVRPGHQSSQGMQVPVSAENLSARFLGAYMFCHLLRSALAGAGDAVLQPIRSGFCHTS